MTKPSQRLLELIASFEAFESEAYICPGGAWTIGYGLIQAIAPSLVTRSADGLSREVPGARRWADCPASTTCPPPATTWPSAMTAATAAAARPRGYRA